SEYASSIIASPQEPLCEENPTRPVGGTPGANVASMRTAGSALMMPMQFGPIRRMPAARQTRISSACFVWPSCPVSPQPAEITTSALTPLRPHASTVSITNFSGTTTTANSTGPGMSSTDLYAGTDWTTSAVGLTG